jgi:hypothetical protein
MAQSTVTALMGNISRLQVFARPVYLVVENATALQLSNVHAVTGDWSIPLQAANVPLGHHQKVITARLMWMQLAELVVTQEPMGASIATLHARNALEVQTTYVYPATLTEACS